MGSKILERIKRDALHGFTTVNACQRHIGTAVGH